MNALRELRPTTLLAPSHHSVSSDNTVRELEQDVETVRNVGWAGLSLKRQKLTKRCPPHKNVLKCMMFISVVHLVGILVSLDTKIQ